MKRILLSCLLSFWLVAPALAQVTAGPTRVWQTSDQQLYLADQNGSNVRHYSTANSGVGVDGTNLTVRINSLTIYLTPATFLNQSGGTYSTVSAAAAYAAFQASVPTSGAGNSTTSLVGLDNSVTGYQNASQVAVAVGSLRGAISTSISAGISFSATNGTIGPTSYDETTGLLFNSGTFGSSVGGAELNYLVVRNLNSFYIIGLQADGSSVALIVNGANTGQIFKASSSGASQGFSASGFPTTPISSLATRIKFEYNSSGDLTVSYKLSETDPIYTVWGTRTRAQQISSGYTISLQKMGNQGGVGGTTQVVEWQTKAGQYQLVGDQLATPIVSDLFLRTYPFYNKSILLQGNSITAEYPGGAYTGLYTGGIQAKTKAAVVTKNGQSGYSLGVASGASGTLINIAPTAISPYYDVVLLEAGTNDFGLGADIGDPTQPTNTTVSSTTTTVGALNTILAAYRTYRPETIVVFCTPLPRTGQATPNTKGKILLDYVNAIKQVCAYYSVPVCDLYSLMGAGGTISASTGLYFQDGLHPNAKGYDRMTDVQVKFLNSLKF